MNNCATPTCVVKTSRAGPWFLLAPLDLQIPRGLSRSLYAEFSFDRTFAGMSPRGIPLSLKESSDPAAIGAIPLVPEKPEGWLALPNLADAGLLVVTADPRLAFFGIRRTNWDCRCTSLCIHPDDLAPIVDIPEPTSRPHPTDVPIEKLTPNLVNLLLMHAQMFKVVLLGDCTYVRIPTSLRLDRRNWTVLGRHLFTEDRAGTFLDTTSIADDPQHPTSPGFPVAEEQECFKLPGRSIEEVSAQWGVDGSKPCAYDGKHLYFTSTEVRQGAKLARVHSNGQRLEGRRLDASGGGDRYPIRLTQALDAGIVPSTGILYVDPAVEYIYLSQDELQIGEFKGPVISRGSYWVEPIILCPRHLVPKYLMPAGHAARAYVIPPGIRPFKVRTQTAAAASNEDPSGSFYLVADLRNLAARDLKKERAERRARNKRLVNRYGSALPKGYEKLSDE